MTTGDAGLALVVDDEPTVRKLYRKACQSMQLGVHEAERGDEGLNLLRGRNYDLLISDYMMPGMDGLELITRARELSNELPIVVVTGYATTERVVNVMRAGADLVVEKPLELAELRDNVKSIIIAKRARQRQEVERSPGPFRNSLPRMVSRFSGAMGELAELMERVAATDCTVLIYGESGTGKELVARAIHEHSNRRSGPFVPVNCGAIPESLLESELFGHKRGSFSGAVRDKPGRFALANQGTIFLDEVGEMSPAFQVKLLRVLQERSFEPVGATRAAHSDFRVIAATHRNIKDMVQGGSFREDLFYRLNVMEINLPPLRERTEDISLLLDHFVSLFNKRHQLKVELGDEQFIEVLKHYGWPGNVRELENMVERSCILQGSGRLRCSVLPQQFTAAGVGGDRKAGIEAVLPEEGVDFNKMVYNFENSLIRQALRRTNGNKNQAASILSLNRTTLVEKIKKRGIN